MVHLWPMSQYKFKVNIKKKKKRFEFFFIIVNQFFFDLGQVFLKCYVSKLISCLLFTMNKNCDYLISVFLKASIKTATLTIIFSTSQAPISIYISVT